LVLKITGRTVLGVEPYRWQFPIPPGAASTVEAWLAAIPLSKRSGTLFRRGRVLIRRRDEQGADYFEVAELLATAPERLYITVVPDSMEIIQVMRSGSRALTIFLTIVCGGVGILGVFAAISGDLVGLILLGFPVFLRFGVTPMTRRKQRDSFEALLTEQLHTLAPRTS
jgi:hypothetical protein